LGGPIEKAPLTSRSCSATVEGGIARAMFRVAVSGRREQEASFFTVVVWRDQAEHAAESLSKGSRPARAQLQDHQLTDLVGRDGHRAHDAILFRCDELVAAGGVRAAWLALVSAHLRHWRAADRRRLRILRQTTRPWAETPRGRLGIFGAVDLDLRWSTGTAQATARPERATSRTVK
jgi:Single-strand binding protein family